MDKDHSEIRKKKKKKVDWLATIVIGLILMIVALLVIRLNGQTILTGEWSETRKVVSIVCNSDDLEYPFFRKIGSEVDSKAKINVILDDDRVSKMSFIYNVFYDSFDDIIKSEAANHAAMNLSFYDNGLETDALDAKYSKLSDSLQMNLYVDADELSGNTMKYFLMDEIDGDGKYDSSVLQQNYKNKGFSCVLMD